MEEEKPFWKQLVDIIKGLLMIATPFIAVILLFWGIVEFFTFLGQFTLFKIIGYIIAVIMGIIMFLPFLGILFSPLIMLLAPTDEDKKDNKSVIFILAIIIVICLIGFRACNSSTEVDDAHRSERFGF